jgi:hypothetical protein
LTNTSKSNYHRKSKLWYCSFILYNNNNNNNDNNDDDDNDDDDDDSKSFSQLEKCVTVIWDMKCENRQFPNLRRTKNTKNNFHHRSIVSSGLSRESRSCIVSSDGSRESKWICDVHVVRWSDEWRRRGRRWCSKKGGVGISLWAPDCEMLTTGPCGTRARPVD